MRIIPLLSLTCKTILTLLNESIIIQAVCLLGFCYLNERKSEKECKAEIYTPGTKLHHQVQNSTKIINIERKLNYLYFRPYGQIRSSGSV